MRFTLPQANMASEKWWLEDYVPFDMVRSQGTLLMFSGKDIFSRKNNVYELLTKLLYPVF